MTTTIKQKFQKRVKDGEQQRTDLAVLLYLGQTQDLGNKEKLIAKKKEYNKKYPNSSLGNLF